MSRNEHDRVYDRDNAQGLFVSDAVGDEGSSITGRPGDHVYLDAYVREVAQKLKCGDWTISLPHDRFCEDDAHATIQFTSGKRVAVIRFGADLLDRSREEQRHTIVHEVIHILINPMESAFDALSSQITSATYSVAWSNFNRHLEEATDQLAFVLAPMLPLPPERPT